MPGIPRPGPILLAGLGALVGLRAPPLSAQPALEQVVAEQAELIRRLNARVAELEARIEAIETAPTAAADARARAATETGAAAATAREPRIEAVETAPTAADARARAAATARNDAASNDDVAIVPELTEEERREQERLVRAAFQRTLIERGGLLLPSWTLDVEPSLSYLHSSAENIVIDGFTILPVLVVGDIVSERVQRELTQASTTLRFGLPWESQLEVRLPFSYHEQQSFSADGTEIRTSASDIGDVDIGFSRQLTRGAGLWPDLLASLRFKSTSGTSPFDIDGDKVIATGTGFESLNLALTGVKVIDPVVYFGSLSYSRNLARDEQIGRYDPGDSVGFSLGMAIALNLNSSLSFTYDQQRTQRVRIDGIGVPGSYLTTGVFSIGASFALGDSLTADLSLGVGTTADSPDVQIQASFPIRLRR